MNNASKVAHLRQIVCWVLMVSGIGMFANAQTPDGPRFLPPEQMVERELKGAETHSYRIEAQRNELLQIRVEQKGIDVVVKLADASGRMLTEVDSPNGTQGFEDLTFIINEAGIYKVDVLSLEANAKKGKYTILRAAPRAATDKDQKSVRARSLSAEATVLLGQSKVESYRTASAKLQEASRLYREIDDKGLEAQALSAAAFASERLGETSTALKLNEQALLLYRATSDKRLEAATLTNMATLHSVLGAKLKAIAIYRLVLPMFPVEDSRSRATILNNIGKVYSELGDWRTALGFYNRALPLRRAAADRGGEAITLHNLGALYEALGDIPKAIAYYDQALKIHREAGNSRGEAVTLNNLGNAYSALGDNQKALEYLSQALRLHERLGNQGEQASSLTSIGSIYYRLGEISKALDYFNRAMPLLQGAGDISGEAITQHYMGLVYWSLGEQRKALDYFNQALPVLRRVGNRSNEADALTGIGSVYSDLGNKQNAITHYLQALQLFRAIDNRSGAAFTLSNLGGTYLDLGARQKSLNYYRQALLLHRETGSKRGEAYALLGIGKINYKSGNKQKALDIFRLALPLFRFVGDRSGEASTLNNMMFVWESLGNLPLAIFYGKQAVNKYQELRRAVRDFDKQTQQTYLGTIERTYKLLAGILIDEGRIAEAEQVLAMLKEEEFYTYLRRDDGVASELLRTVSLTVEESEALRRYAELADKITSIGKEFGELDTERKSYDGAFPKQARYDELKKQLADATVTFQLYLDQLKIKFGQTARVSQVESGLQILLERLNADRTAIVSTIVDENRLHVIVTTAYTQRAHTIEITGKEINQLVAEFRQALTDPLVDPRPAGQKLYNLLVRPIEPDLTGITADTILWSLDGALRYVPTAALWDSQKGYLVERFASAVLTLASTDALGLRVTDKRNWTALGVGVSQAIEGFEALKAVPDELDCIITDEETRTVSLHPICAQGVIAGKKLLDEKFTRVVFEDFLGRFPVIHIASHFHLSPGNDKDTFLLLGGGEQKRYTVENLRSMSLKNVELIVLSACNTGTPGGEKANGAEVEGFGAVAQKKGAKAVLATLWSVADESTRDLMVEFYRINSEENLTKTEALRQAQLTMAYGKYLASDGNTRRGSELLGLNRKTSVRVFKKDPRAPFAHPYYWSSFIVMGNWR